MARSAASDKARSATAQSNGAITVTVLTLLNRALVELVTAGEPDEPLQRLLEDAGPATGARALVIFRLADGGAEAEAVAVAGSRPAARGPMAAALARFRHGDGDCRDGDFHILPLTCDGATHGWLVAECAPRGVPSAPCAQMLSALAQGLGEVLAGCARAQRQRRNRIREERAAIARELHDSLAQSLSYLKIQASRLQAALNSPDAARSRESQRMGEIVGELRSHLNVAYRQLRELITTFRLTMNGRTLSQAVEESVDEFQRRSTIAFEVDDRLCGDELEADEEIQVLQIAREALSNIVRHSHARRARLTLKQQESGEITLGIEDDGVGLDVSPEDERHHGLVIMQERARDLDGSLRVEPAAGGGTRVRVRFVPRALARHGVRS